MIWIIAPAKSMNEHKHIAATVYTKPIFIGEAETLIGELKKYDPVQLSSLMKISDKLSELNIVRYHRWKSIHDKVNSKRAIAYYDGEVYKQINAEELDSRALNFMQRHLRIISGLYGILRPFDIIKPYRLEMGIKLKNSRGNDLYDFWREKITDYFNEEIKEQKDDILINLSSKEYSQVIDVNKFKGSIINIIFKEYRNGKYKIIPFNAKRARGAYG
ncbi:YaaA family protein [Clostridium pasteurianum]|uniref:YaaA family protein n=1 Tax=Clostridium pasteurianum TaxID=1501 RepID=UPI001FA825E1|nr:YaaA family protein [Clostridium pasteurianum]